MRRTNLYLDERRTSALDRAAHAEGISRAALVRRLIDESFGAEPNGLEADLAAIEESFGILLDVDAADRGPDDRAAHLERIRRR